MFKPANISAHTMKFNSAISSDLHEMLEQGRIQKIKEERNTRSSKFIAPSSFRCRRIAWFRLRGCEKDRDDNPDTTLDFTTHVGTACHRLIQSTLSEVYPDCWVDVAEYLHKNGLNDLSSEKDGYEYKIESTDPPVRFACDGVLSMSGKNYILEIKSSEYAAFNDLIEPKSQHIDQAKCYSAILRIPDILFVYIDRQYGSIKVFEVNFKQYELDQIVKDMRDIKEMADNCIAPEGLPKGDSWCTPSYCPYFAKCKEWGR